MDYWIYDAPEDEYKLSDEEIESYEKKREGFIAFVLVASLLLGVFGAGIVKRKNTRRENNQRNASYITEATIDTPYYDWCLDAVNIDTLVCIAEGKAHLYEIDEGREEFLENFENGVYKVLNDNGEYQYIPVSMALSFPTHEEAEEYAKQMVGEENIICANYPKHNSAKTRKLVP